MTKRQIHTAILTILLIPFLRAVPALASGDKVVPHVVDGDQGDGIRYRTKFDITNISPWPNTVLTKVSVLFYKDDGTPWTVAIKDPVSGNALNVSSYTPLLGMSQTVRVETLGTGSLASGFAIIRNLEVPANHLEFADQGEVAITVYFEVLSRNSQGGYDIIDTVSVPTSQPTVSWTFPVEIDKTKSPSLLTGFAMVNLSDVSNAVTIDLWETKAPLSNDAVQYPQSASLVLSGTNPTTSKKAVGFLDQAAFFPGITKFKGMAVASSSSPVAILALLQTPTPTGVQFATLVPAYLDSLRRNTLMYLPQGYSLDADIPVVDYFRDETSAADPYYETPWDVLFQSDQNVTTGRWLTSQQGAMFHTIGVIAPQNAGSFDTISLDNLRSFTYSTDSIDLGDSSGNLVQGFTFAIKTGLGRYVKVRVRDWVEYTNSSVKDLLLEIYVFK
ncbi:MAG: hypothetical protein LAP85_22815 [Acidobacteriia bacterium]|nr:hypothetical protein [Terriglobia bacterium]